MIYLINMKKLKDIDNKYHFLKGISETEPELLILIDTGEFLIDIDKDPSTYIHKDFRIKKVALMKGYSGEYDEQDEKLNSGKPHESEFWLYLSETVKYRKEQIIRTDKAIIF
jgi:hypothetical protein